LALVYFCHLAIYSEDPRDDIDDASRSGRLTIFARGVFTSASAGTALHSGVARPGYHRVAAALKSGPANLTIIVNSKPITICPSHCIKLFMPEPVTLSPRAYLCTILYTFPDETCARTLDERKQLLLCLLGRKPFMSRLSCC